jgi:hypothetical protein
LSFQLKPEGLTGIELFEHMVTFRRRTTKGPEVFEPETRLGLEITDIQKKILAPSEQDMTAGSLMKDACGEGATQKHAKRKLDALGDIKAHCCFANGPERFAKLKRAAELAVSLSAINRAEQCPMFITYIFDHLSRR